MSIPAKYIGLGLLLAGGVSPALADLAPLEAASLLAEARGADEKCAFLEPQESERLGYLAAKAEVAAVSAAGVEKAGSTLQRARLKGETGTCEAETRTQVLEVYSAANLALKEATGEVKPGAGPMNITPPPTRPATRPVAPPPAQQVPRQPVSQHLPLHQPQHRSPCRNTCRYISRNTAAHAAAHAATRAGARTGGGATGTGSPDPATGRAGETALSGALFRHGGWA